MTILTRRASTEDVSQRRRSGTKAVRVLSPSGSSGSPGSPGRAGAMMRARAKSHEDAEPQQSLLRFAKRQSLKAETLPLARKLGFGAFDTPDMLAARRALKSNPAVLEALKEWWIATDADSSGAIDKDEYIELLKAIYRVKVSDDDEDDCQHTAEVEAEEDFVGILEMTEPRFHETIFELGTRGL